MLFKILPIFLIIAICVKVPMTRRLIFKFPIVPKIGKFLLNVIKDIVFSNERMQNNINNPNPGAIGNNLYPSTSLTTSSSSYTSYTYDSEMHSTSISNYSNRMQPGNMYYNN